MGAGVGGSEVLLGSVPEGWLVCTWTGLNLDWSAPGLVCAGTSLHRDWFTQGSVPDSVLSLGGSKVRSIHGPQFQKMRKAARRIPMRRTRVKTSI